MLQNKLKHKVVFCSSEDSGFSSKELNNSSADSKGWLSSRFPEYPQEIGFELISGNSNDRNLHLTQVQILSHQSKIATKIEIFIGIGNDYLNATFKRLGFLSLDGNERSSYQARELKTVYVDQLGNYLKFRIQKNYINDQNPFNQVGLMAVNFFGNESSSSSSSSSSAPFLSNENRQNSIMNSSNNNILGIDVKLDSSTMAKLKILSDAKSKAIENEDYITAKAIKIAESEIKELTTQLAKLDADKKEAVITEDYDLARELKEQGDVLRKSISQKIMSIHIPGVVVSAPVPLNASHRPVTGDGGAGNRQSNNNNSNSPDHNNNNHSISGKNNKSNNSYSNNNNYSNNAHDEKPVAAAMKRMNIDDPLVSGSGVGRAGRQKGVSPENSNDDDNDDDYENDNDFDNDNNGDGNNSRPQSNSNNRRLSKSPGGINNTTNNRKLSSAGVNGVNSGDQDISMIDKTHHEDDPVAVQSTGPKGSRYNINSPSNNIGDNGFNFNMDSGGSGMGGGEDEYYAGSGSGRGKPSSQQFPPGEHPLEGAVTADTDVNNLPDPDPFSIKSKSLCEQTGILRLLDDYCARCLFSKSWILRDAAINKTHLLLLSQLHHDDNDNDDGEGHNKGGDNKHHHPDGMNILASILPAVVAVCKVGIEDKNSQVNFGAFDFLEQIMNIMNQYKINRSVALPAFENVGFIVLLIEKLSDSNQRAREGARKALNTLSNSNCITSNPIANTTLKTLSAKQKLAWRPLQSRLMLLTDLISQHGLGNTSGIYFESIMNYMKTNNAFAHSSVEVREAAKELTVVIQKLVGTAAIEPYLAELRPKQRGEYAHAFGESNNNGNNNGISPSPRGSSSSSSGVTPTKKPTAGATAANTSTRAASGGSSSGGNNNNKNNNNNNNQPPQRGVSPKASGSRATSGSSGANQNNNENDKLSNLRNSQNLNNNNNNSSSSSSGSRGSARGGGTPNKHNHSNNNNQQQHGKNNHNNNNRSSSNSPLRNSQNNVKNISNNNRYQKSNNDDDDEDFAADEKRSSAEGGDNNNQSLRASQKYLDNKQYQHDDDHNTSNNNNNNNKANSNNNANTSNDNDDDNDDAIFLCQFCGEGGHNNGNNNNNNNNESWTEDMLDAHYLSVCPYLAPCPACQQILEIASLPDHLLDECKFKSQYVPCDTTGLAIKSTEMSVWQKSKSCVSPPDNCFYCPMCLRAVEDDTEPWRVHLLQQCTQNRRRMT